MPCRKPGATGRSRPEPLTCAYWEPNFAMEVCMQVIHDSLTGLKIAAPQVHLKLRPEQ